MNRCLFMIIVLTLLVKAEMHAQPQRFVVKRAPFSSRTNDEFSPVFYKGGVVFCSNLSDNSLVNYRDQQKGLFKIFFAANKDSTGWRPSRILAKEISSDCNDGPATFNEKGNIIYYSRNNSIEKSLRNISDTSNKLGIYSAELIGGIWTNIRPFPYNDPLHTFCTPALSPDGERIYFSSDMPGGIGGMDIYYCDRRNNEWQKPVNLGPFINTPKNESFPFAGKYGKLYFASDGHEGFGGKDLYYTQQINEEWIVPVHLDSPINSPEDDFGLVTDSTFANGYFSTNRLKTDDIFSFDAAPVEFAKCDKLQENNFCFTFYDEQHQLIDTIPTSYQWDFGDGIIHTGTEIKHCFPGPGKYTVKLSIIDELTGKAIADQVEYDVDLENIEQAYINSNNVGLVNKPVSFDGMKTSLKNFKITDYFWNFGSGFRPGGPYMSRSFKKSGEYTVQLGLLAEEDSLGVIPRTCVEKKIRIYSDYKELLLSDRKEIVPATGNTAVADRTETMQVRIYLMDDLAERQQAKIREAFNKSGKLTVACNQYGLSSSSYPVLDCATGILKENPGIRLEIVVHAAEGGTSGSTAETSEKWARELAFYFRNREMEKEAVHCKGSGLPHPIFEPFVTGNLSIKGVVDFIFMEN